MTTPNQNPSSWGTPPQGPAGPTPPQWPTGPQPPAAPPPAGQPAWPGQGQPPTQQWPGQPPTGSQQWSPHPGGGQPAKKKGFPIWAIIAIIVVLLAAVGTGGFFGLKALTKDDDKADVKGSSKQDKSKDEKSKEKPAGKLVTPPGEPYSFRLPVTMKEAPPQGAGQGAPVYLKLKQESGPPSELNIIYGGNLAPFEGASIAELEPAIDQELTQLKSAGGQASEVTQKKLGNNQLLTGQATLHRTDSQGNDELRTLVINFIRSKQGTVLKFYCVYNAANAKAMNKACQDFLNSIEIKSTSNPGEKPGPGEEPTPGGIPEDFPSVPIPPGN